MTDLNAKRAGNRIWILAGLLAVVAVAGYFSLNYPPAGEDTAGTIAPAKRYHASDAGGAGGSAPGADKSGISSIGADSYQAAAADAADKLGRSDKARSPRPPATDR